MKFVYVPLMCRPGFSKTTTEPDGHTLRDCEIAYTYTCTHLSVTEPGRRVQRIFHFFFTIQIFFKPLSVICTRGRSLVRSILYEDRCNFISAKSRSFHHLPLRSDNLGVAAARAQNPLYLTDNTFFHQ